MELCNIFQGCLSSTFAAAVSYFGKVSSLAKESDAVVKHAPGSTNPAVCSVTSSSFPFSSLLPTVEASCINKAQFDCISPECQAMW